MARKHTPDAHRWTVADSVTAARMAASLALLFLPVFSASFLTVYTFAGLTDALDGFLARKTGTVSAFGARLDSAADLLFFGVLLLRLFPLLRRTQPAGIWYVAGIVLLVRLISYAVAAVRFRRFDALHTRLNKPTGAAVFPLPYVLAVSGGIWYCRLVCFLALVASVQELALQFRRPASQEIRYFAVDFSMSTTHSEFRGYFAVPPLLLPVSGRSRSFSFAFAKSSGVSCTHSTMAYSLSPMSLYNDSAFLKKMEHFPVLFPWITSGPPAILSILPIVTPPTVDPV